MEIRSSSTIKTSTLSIIDLNADDITNATTNYGTLTEATRAGYFSPITASQSDIVAVEEKDDGTAIIVVVAERTTVTSSANSAS
jgi:hypothetical protein